MPRKVFFYIVIKMDSVGVKLLRSKLSVSSISKCQLISKCPYGVFKSPKKTNEIFSRISAQASKKRSNQKNKGTLYHKLEDFILTLLHYFFDLTSF